MNFIKQVLSLLIFFARGDARRLAVCALVVAAAAASPIYFQPRRAQAQQSPATLSGAAALEQLKRDGQYESLQAAMDQARFSVSRAESTPLGRWAWLAPNASAGYDVYVTEEGVSVAIDDKTIVSLNLKSVGYGKTLQAISPGEVIGDKQTISITRESGVREWLVNSPEGLEHGFTLGEPPGVRQKGAPLRLALQVSAGWRAVASEDGKCVTLRGAGDQAVEYGKLVARDNQGRNIPARLTVDDGQVIIEVEDSDAVYPLTIDPIFTLQRKLTAADGAAQDFLGYAVALSGDTALLGAPYDDLAGMEQGSAYVFVRNGATWTQQARLTAQDGASFDYFGWSVALDGDYALVGAVYGPGSVNPDQGAAYVFVRGGNGTWSQQARLNAGDGQAQSQFGAAVAIDGQTALIGAYKHEVVRPFGKTGAAYVFVRNGAAWTQQARLNANDSIAEDNFGFSVALDGDTALIGEPADGTDANENRGAAFIFTRSGGVWGPPQKLTAINGAANDSFGAAVALSGEKALIGAHLYGSDDRGAVYTFRRDAAGWRQIDTIDAPNPTAGAHFGVSVALGGDTAVIGAARGLFSQGVDQRSAYVFVYSDEWLLVRRLGSELGSTNDGFGYAVALDGATALVGAYRGDAVANDQGAAYAFALRDVRHTEQQKLTSSDGRANQDFGCAVALDGDTLAVGSLYDVIGMNSVQGSVYVFTRNGAVWTLQQKLTADDGEANDQFGHAVALRGDTLVVGANGDDVGGKANQGSAYIFTRNGTVWAQRQKLTAVGIDGLPGDKFGSSVALSGHTVGVGAPGMDNYRGSAYVFTFNGQVWKQQAKLSANDGAESDFFGGAIALEGDTLAVGARDDSIGANALQGSAYVFTRSGAVWAQSAKLVASDGALNDHFGGAVALSDDMLVVGAVFNAVGANARQGSAYVFARVGAAWVPAQKLTASDGAAEDNFGSSVALRDGVLVIGAQKDTIGMSGQQGSAYVFTFEGGWRQRQKLTASDGAARDEFGEAVALSGDTLVVGVRSDDINGNSDQGSVYIFNSPPCPALTIGPPGLPNGALGAAYNQQLTASGSGGGDYQFTVSGGALPPGLTLDQSGLLHGASAATGTYRFTITTTFLLSGCSGSRDYAITVTPPCPAITILPTTLPNGGIDTEYNLPLTAAGGQAPYSFSVTAGALPGGLSLSNAGALAGAPTASGSFDFTGAAVDANGCRGSRAYTLVVSGCFYTVAPTPQSFSAIAQTGNVTVATTSSCAWTAQSDNSWITLSKFGGKGSGSVSFTVAANNGAERMGALTIAGQIATVTQAALPGGTPRLLLLAPNAARRGTNGLILNVIGASFTENHLAQWNGAPLETSFVSATQLRAVIPAASLAQEGTAAVKVVDTANGAQSNLGKFRILGAVAHASAASYDTITLAPESIVAAFGSDLAAETRVAESLPLPTELAGVTVTVRDSLGAESRAPIFFVAPSQVNYLLPQGLANGIATVTIANGDGVAIQSLTEISAVAPGLFSANASGGGAAAAVALRIRANGEQVYEPVARYDAPTQTFALLPIDLSNPAEQVYLILFGTGARHRGKLEDVTIRIGEMELPVAYAGAAPGLAGVDQVNVLLPASLRGQSEQTVTLRVNDEASNGVNIRIQ